MAYAIRECGGEKVFQGTQRPARVNSRRWRHGERSGSDDEMENGAENSAPFLRLTLLQKGVFLQLQREANRRCAALSRSVLWNDGFGP
ncbi:MAG: hypothetical protein M0Q22_02350 [Sulfuritalea sp.]|nr:hypothetical protein [Sulfuritalea sp.]